MMRLVILFFFAFISTAVNASFEGQLILEPEGCEKIRECSIKHALRFTGPNGLVWEARSGLKTDGATIPFWAQPIIGQPYDQSFLKAAVVHDHYCDRRVRSWRETHRVFYHMLRSLDVPEVKAKVMYYAVVIGGPKWVSLVPGNDCGENCINKFAALSESERYIYDQKRYDRIDDLEERLRNIEARLLEDDLTLDEIDEIAKSQSSDKFFFLTGDSHQYDPSVEIDR